MMNETTTSWASIAIRNTPARMTPTVFPSSVTVEEEKPAKTTSDITNEVVSSTVKSEVHPQALEIAKDFYTKYYEDIVQTNHREELRSVFAEYAPQANNRAFSIVLYAMAKGMRVVNVFNRGQIEWRESSTTHEYFTMKKRSGKQKLIAQADGWTSVGVPSTDVLNTHPHPTKPKMRVNESIYMTLTVDSNNEDDTPDNTRENIPDNTRENIPDKSPTSNTVPSPRFSREGEYVMKTKVSTSCYNMDDLMERIRQLNDQIKIYDTEIENLIPFQREHLREMRRIDALTTRSDMDERLSAFHDTQAQRVADMLDSIQDEMNALIREKREMCDRLKL